MSYLNISEAAWSLVLSKDPRIRPKPRTPVSASSGRQLTPPAADSTAAPAAPPGQLQPQHQNNNTVCHNGESSSKLPNSSLRCTQDKVVSLPGGRTSSPQSWLQSTPAAAAQRTQQLAGGGELHATQQGADDAAALPMELQLGGHSNIASLPSTWSPSSGESPGRWLAAAHGSSWAAAAAAAGREATVAHRQVLGALEQRRAALLKDIGRARELDLKLLLQLVQTYTDNVQALLSSVQASSLKAQQDYTQHLTAAAAAAVGGSIEAALEAAHKTHQEQVSHLQQQHSAQLEAARSSASQQLAAALSLQGKEAQEKLKRQVWELNNSWDARCRNAEAAAEKQSALKGAAESECSKLRAELAAAKREAANWRARWEKDCSAGGATHSGCGSNSGSTDGGASAALARAGSGVPGTFVGAGSAALPGRRTSRPSIS